MSPVSIPTAIHYPDLAEMLAARDALLSAWRNGIVDGENCQRRLASLSAPDADGNQWRLRPGQHGAVLVRISPTGETSIVTAEDYLPPPPATPKIIITLRRATAVAYVALWVIVAFAYLQG